MKVLGDVKFIGTLPEKAEKREVKVDGQVFNFAKDSVIKGIDIKKAQFIVDRNPGEFKLVGTNVEDPEAGALRKENAGLKAQIEELKKKK